MDLPVLYYAFVRRGPDRRFRASFVDFPDWDVAHESVEMLPQAAWDVALAHLAAGQPFLSKPTAFHDLPRMQGEWDGYWMGFDLSASARTVGGSVVW